MKHFCFTPFNIIGIFGIYVIYGFRQFHDPQITWKWTMHTDKLTTKFHICLHTCKQGGFLCRIWDWQSTVVKDLNESQDPKHTLFAIYARFQTTNVPFLPFRGRRKGTMSPFTVFLYRGFPYFTFITTITVIASSNL